LRCGGSHARGRASHNMGRGGRQDTRAQYGSEPPRDKAVSGIPKEHLVGVDIRPFGPQTRGKIAGDDDQVDTGGISEGRRRNSGIRPWRYRLEP